LEGKVALVTGAARGTGAEIARCFVAEGAQVLVADVLDDRVEAVAAELGPAATARHLDVTDEGAWEALVAGLDRLDVLVNNAAVLHLATIDATTTAAFEQVLRVNALGPFLGTRACLPLLRASGRGSIVNIGSIESVAGAPLTAAYTASKFALRGLTKVTALENRRLGVRANLVCPEAGNPEMHPPVVGWEHLGPPARDAPPGRGPEAVAPAAVFFASDESALCNGTELVLDAGRSAGQYFELPDELYAARGAPAEGAASRE
jgi:3alpha(or 20beta)-hydroxysteroid dehydrogenase